MGVSYNKISAFEIQMDSTANLEQIKNISKFLANYNIEINNDTKQQLVIQIKEHIAFMINNNVNEKVSTFLNEKMDYSYRYLSTVFREVTYSSIENFYIFQKIEYVKQLAISQNLTLTEIAYKMNYCSVAHLSRQFKKTTGLTFQEFQKIISGRKQLKA